MAEIADVAIVGGGICGLALAYYLEQAGRSTVIIENNSALGGIAQSKQVDGFLLEFAANSTLALPEFLDFVESVGASGELLQPLPAATSRFVALQKNNELKLVSTPRTFAEFVSSPILSASEKLRLFAEPFVPRTSANDETVKDFTTRRFGPGMSQLYDTLLGGMYAADTTKLSTRSALPHMWNPEQEYGSVTLGNILHRQKYRRTRQYVAFRQGMGSLAGFVEKKLRRGKFLLGATVRTVDADATGVRIQCSSGNGEALNKEQSVRAQACCFTGAAKATAAAFSAFLGEDVSRLVTDVPYAPVGVLHLAVAEPSFPAAFRGFGALVSPHEQLALLGVIFNSCVFSGRAPAGSMLLTCFVGGKLKPQFAAVNDKQIQKQVISEVMQLLHLQETPRVLAATAYMEAIPNYPLGHYRLVEQLEAFQRQHPRLKLLGSWITGLSFADRVLQAKKVAHELQQADIWQADFDKFPTTEPHQIGR